MASKMKKRSVAIGLLGAASVALGGWFLWARFVLMPNVGLSDVRNRETLVLREELGKPVHGITIRGSGEVEGDATVSLVLNGDPYIVAKLNGKVDFQWGGDWYSETAQIRYEPEAVRSGKVVLHYRFRR